MAAMGTGLSLPLVLKLLRYRSVFDVPNDRSSHASVTIRGGGVAMVLPGMIGLSLLDRSGTEFIAGFLGLMLLAGTGLRDDISPMSVRYRLLAQIIAGLSIGWGVSGQLLGAVLSAVFVAAVVNAFNFMDGVNGISSFTMAIAGGAYIALGQSASSLDLQVVGAVAAGVGIGFLPFNFPNARVFLGDAGSYFCGGLLALATILAIDSGVGFFAALTPVGLYGFDTAFTIARRAGRGERPGAAHREHVYQRVAQLRGHVWATATASLASLLIVLVGIWNGFDQTAPSVLSVALIVVVLAGYASLPHLISPEVV